MIKNIIVKNGKSYLKVSKNNWNLYLNKFSPNRSFDNNLLGCGLKNKNLNRCLVCNKDIGDWSYSCVNIISTLNLHKNSDMFTNDILKNNDFYEIEIDKNDDSSTI